MTAKFDLSKFTQPARKMLERAQNLASTLKHQNVDIEHALEPLHCGGAVGSRLAIELVDGPHLLLGV